jgi:hypothetical protein
MSPASTFHMAHMKTHSETVALLREVAAEENAF